MLNRLGGTAADLALDLGTSRTRIADRTGTILVDEPSVVALQAGRVVAVGEPARKRMGRTGPQTRVSRPVQNGRIEDFRSAELLLAALFKRVSGPFRHPRVLVSAPPALSEVESRALHECIRAAGAREVYSIPAGLAAGVGASLPIQDPIGSVICVVGAGRTEVTVASLGGVVVHEERPVGGHAMDTAIGTWALQHHGLQLAERTRRHIKRQLASAVPAAHQALRVRGRHRDQGAPQELEATVEAVREAIEPVIHDILSLVVLVLRQCPPELAADIVDRGLILTGGAARLPGLDVRLREAAQLPVLLLEEPDLTTIKGCAALLSDSQAFTRMAMRSN